MKTLRNTKKAVSAMSLLFGFFRCYKCRRNIEKLKCVCEKYQFKYKHRLNYKYKHKYPDHHLNFVLNAEFHIPDLGRGDKKAKCLCENRF